LAADHLSPHRKGKIGSSMVAALFGRSPYLTRMELFAHFTRGHDIDATENERMVWGRRLQDDILEAVVEAKGWEVEPNPDSWVEHPDPELRAGSTVDAWVRNHDMGLGVVECKAVDRDIYRRDWTDETGPQHIELQVQHQLWTTGAAWAVMAVLVGGNELRFVPKTGVRLPIPAVHAALDRAIRGFWASIAAGEPPPTQGTEGEIAALATLYDELLPEPVQKLPDDERFAKACADLKWAQEKRKLVNKVYNEARAFVLSRTKDYQLTRTTGALVRVERQRMTEAEIRRQAHWRTTVTITEFPEERPVQADLDIPGAE
jgi:putative phage-type endonuclease